MSTLASLSSSAPLGVTAPAGAAPKAGLYRARRSFDGARGLAGLVLAALVASLVVVADRLISTWADDHLLLAWVALWVVIFAGLALFGGTARQLAQRAMRSLDGWSKSLAEARAEARLWDLARKDPRLMAELMQARMREYDASHVVAAPAPDDFSEALAPLGLETATTPVARGGAWERFGQRMAEHRSRTIHLHYI
jgi:hypothetical protein